MKLINSYKYAFSSLLLGLGISACEPKLDVPTPSKGSADFTKYVALGNSLTAGYADGGLYREGQLVAYPNLIAQQLKAVGGGEFTQPLFTEAQANGSGYLTFAGFNANGTPKLAPVTTSLAIRAVSPQILYTKYTEPINNFGVPGIRLADILTPGYGSAQGNAYLERLYTDAEVFKTYQAKVLESKPTFFSSWLGNNDVLGYATSGGLKPITDPSDFQTKYMGLVDALIAGGAKGGVLATIPDVTVVPYFNTVTLASIKAQTKGTPLEQAAVLIKTGTGAIRTATAADLIVLTADSIGLTRAGKPTEPKGFHPNYPLNNEDVLDKDEVAEAVKAVDAYNQSITAIAKSKGLALVTVSDFLNEIKTGTAVNGAPASAAYITGGIFSLDGVHLTPRGNAITANAFIKAINTKYGSSISTVNVADYRGTKFP